MARLYASTVALVAVAAAAATAASAESLVCEDVPGFTYGGYSCAKWGEIPKYCSTTPDFVYEIYPDDPEAFNTIRENCPLACGTCAAPPPSDSPPITCEDDPDFEYGGHSCAVWADNEGWGSCSAKVESWKPASLNPEALNTVKEGCPLSCDDRCTLSSACKKFGGSPEITSLGPSSMHPGGELKAEVCDNDEMIAEFLGKGKGWPGTRCPTDAPSLCKDGQIGPIVSFMCPITCGVKKLKEHDNTLDNDNLAGMIEGLTSCMDVDRDTCKKDKAVESYLCPQWCAMDKWCQKKKIAAYKKTKKACEGKGKKSKSKCIGALMMAAAKWSEIYAEPSTGCSIPSDYSYDSYWG